MGIAAAAPLALSVLGAGASAFSSVSQGDYQAQVASNNAAIARQNETNAYATGAQQEQQNAFKTRAEIGQQKAGQASNGLDVNSGSALDVRAGTSAIGQLSGLTIANNAARRAYGYQSESDTDEAQSALDRQEGNFGAVSSLVSGASDTAGLYSTLKRSGAFSPDTPKIIG